MNESVNDGCLLDYAIISEPFPLYAAASDDTPPSTLHIVISNGGGTTVYCREIVFSLPHGDLAQSLVDANAGDGDGGADGWHVERIQEGANLVLPPGDFARFVVTPPADATPLDRSGIVITLKNLRISKKPGTARIEIRETATANQGDWQGNPRYTSLPITKFPTPAVPVQLVNDFHAEQCEVAAGEAVRLTWRGPETLEYKVLHGPGATPDAGYDGAIKDFQWKGTVKRDTVFHLTYPIAGSTHYLTTAVTVSNPTLDGLRVEGDKGLYVQKNATVDGDLTVGNDTNITGTLAATADITTHAHFLDPNGIPLKGN
ncbi:hypothetical protein [Streptomyces griseocarneus]|uniref:hypothetical protein n=1 Tax=Streptomyces griseocarneus TaxID=51201 RepID=UPI00167D6F31|nr:hypothetical protein [Streptomyces griseocarneus]MBZ6475793.1 hypothetical protein [Streptomyces griseocarneus]GHG50760.1 hypothetical protein GCM10018779_11130 [Streptomyces griseocarneus]